MKRLTSFVAAAVFAAATASAQTVSEQNQEILKELKAIRALLEKLVASAPAAPTAAPVDERVSLARVTGRMLGKPDAPLTIVEFTDLQCPFCRQFSLTAFPQIKKDYIDTGKVRFITNDFPLESIHPLAVTAARASACADAQGKFWEMRHTILVNNAALKEDSFATFARDLRLDVPAFQSCMTQTADSFRATLQRDLDGAREAGVTAAPTFIIGVSTGAGVDGVRLIGAHPFATFDEKLKQLLQQRANQ